MTMPGGHGNWATLRSYSRDQCVARQKLAPGTLGRIATFAAPYRRWLVIFLILILFDAILGAANPLIYKEIIDSGILPKNVGVVYWLPGPRPPPALPSPGGSLLVGVGAARV